MPPSPQKTTTTTTTTKKNLVFPPDMYYPVDIQPTIFNFSFDVFLVDPDRTFVE